MSPLHQLRCWPWARPVPVFFSGLFQLFLVGRRDRLRDLDELVGGLELVRGGFFVVAYGEPVVELRAWFQAKLGQVERLGRP